MDKEFYTIRWDNFKTLEMIQRTYLCSQTIKRSKNKALLHSRHDNPYVREYCGMVMRGEHIIMKVKEFNVCDTITLADDSKVLIHEFPDRKTVILLNVEPLTEDSKWNSWSICHTTIEDLRERIRGNQF